MGRLELEVEASAGMHARAGSRDSTSLVDFKRNLLAWIEKHDCGDQLARLARLSAADLRRLLESEMVPSDDVLDRLEKALRDPRVDSILPHR